MRRTRFLIWLNALLFATLIAVMATPMTGVVAHEWLGVAIAGVVLVHIVLQWDWLATAFRRFPGGPMRLGVNLVLNGFLFVAMVVAIYSGVMISVVVRPAIGLASSVQPAWGLVHSVSVLLAMTMLVGLHLAINWRWITNVAVRLFVLGTVGRREQKPGANLGSPADGDSR
jgi:hypothetical protein